MRIILRLVCLIAVLLSLGACARDRRGRSFPYAKLAQRIGTTSGGESLLADGQTLELVLRKDPSGAPLEGARLFLGDEELTGEHGRFSVPFSLDLARINPTVRIVPPDGYDGGIRFEFGLTLNDRSCDGHATARERLDLSTWIAIDVGPDRIYLEPPNTLEDARHVERLLREGRRLLTELSGARPPPLAVGLMREDAPERYATPDRDGRAVWLARPSRSREDDFVGLIVHEWTHGLLNEVGFADDTQVRFVEDGLANLLGHLAERQLLGHARTPQLEGAQRVLSAMSADERVDLYALAERHAGAGSVASFIDALCEKGTVDGYALGMAYWLGRTGGRRDAIRAQFDAWRSGMPENGAALEAALRASGPSPRSFTVAEARAWASAP